MILIMKQCRTFIQYKLSIKKITINTSRGYGDGDGEGRGYGKC